MNEYSGLCGGRLLTAAVAIGLLAALPQQAGAQTKPAEKWITVVGQAEPPDLEPCNSTRTYQGRILKQNVVETLVQKMPEDGSLKPRLATSWQRKDPNTWVFKLREGVSFHDGTPFNAETAKKSMDRTLRTPSKIVCNVRTQYFSGLKFELTALDATTLQIATDKPDPILPTRLATMTIGGPNAALEELTLAPVGTGPYVFDSWRAGQEIVLRRNEKYWGTKPAIEGVRHIWRSESSVRAAMVEIGEADYTPFIAVQEAKNPKSDHAYLNSETTFGRLDMDRAPLNDKRVRQAMNFAVDRESIRLNILSKDFLHSTQIIIPAIPGHNHEIDKKIIPYDPAKAKQLIAAAKADKVPVENEILLINNPAYFPQATELAEALMALYKAVGLNIKFMNAEPAEYSRIHNKPYEEGRGPTLLMSQHDNNSGDPIFSIFYKYTCSGATSMFCDPAFDKEIDRVGGLEGQARAEGFRELFRQLYEDISPSIWLYHMVAYARVGSRIAFVPDVTSGSELRIEEIKFK